MKNSFYLISILFLSLSVSAQSRAVPGNNALRQKLKEEGLKSNAVKQAEAPIPTETGRPERKMMNLDSIRGYHSRPDSIMKIGLLLPFDYAHTSSRIYGYIGDKELSKSDLYKLKESSREALDFYQGLQYALSHSSSPQLIEIYAYDTEGSDSIVQELLANPLLRHCNIIIGPASPAEAKIVAAYCKKNNIFNIQPFVASKSISSENPYLVRLMPTIDAHLQKEYEMVLDSFQDKNIIVYTTKRERDLSAARQLDTLFKSYNAMNTHKLRYTFLNTGDSALPAAKRTLSAHLLPQEMNVVLMTCYDEALVNSTLRTAKDNVVIFGMPTWLDGDQIRVDYLSNAQPYFTDNFYADTARSEITSFTASYTEAYSQPPSRYSYMGYDALSYLSLIFDRYGFDIADGINKESYEGLGYSFHLSPVLRSSKTTYETVVNYYANTAMHLFQVRDYRVHLVK